MKTSRKYKLMRLMEKAKFTEDEIGETIVGIDDHKLLMKAVFEAQAVIKAQNHGNCIVSVLKAIEKMEGK